MFPLDVPIVIQDGIIAALFAAAAGLLLYKMLRKKSKSCPACAGDCAPVSNTPVASKLSPP
ncbi:MAG: FeoB-associated Cys-rich membrane protein [candidate division Zixibacteria bacterium]|nr:FeoB-associated Cys-rich membrane protein [candidate division Zixibacteria bacterium]MCI0595698.1 FeoB-associated Cys-rich membrane protein [candidate division Zixibacteria bacterium]